MRRAWRGTKKTGVIMILLAAGLAVLPALRYYYQDEPQAIYFVPGNPAGVALTFETRWSSDGLDQILDILERENARVTFFITGTWLKENPHAAKKILQKGHEIANHTQSHQNLLYLNEAELAEEIAGFDRLARELLDYRPRVFRPPLGLYNGMVLKEARRNRCRTVLWSVESYDSLGGDADEIAGRVTAGMRGGAVVLFRVGPPALVEALPLIMTRLREQGLEPVTVSELLRMGARR
jgi:peptidoglycan-N-acetylglucosamine deacetylase